MRMVVRPVRRPIAQTFGPFEYPMSAGSSIAEQGTFQFPDGGAIPTSAHQLVFSLCNFSDIREIFEKYHYKKSHMGGGISFCLKAQYKGRTIGGSVIGLPRHSSKYKGMLEIRRMAFIDDAPKNSESRFLGFIIRHIKKNTDSVGVISYADKSVGHKGTIYKAANFKLAGETSASLHVFWNGKRYHPRSLTIDRPYSYALREAVKNGTATVEKGEPKSIWVYRFWPCV